MTLIRLILWIAAGSVLVWLLLPIIGMGILFFAALLAILFLVSLISRLFTGRGGFVHTFTFRTSPREKAEAAKAEEEEIFDAEFGEDAGEVVELPPSALHKE